MARSEARDILLDVRRLIWRIWSNHMPTGVDHVCLAYLHHYAARAQAVVEWKGSRRILSPRKSDRLFDILRFGSRHFRRDVVLGGLQTVLTDLKQEQDGAGRLYLNVGHTGLESSSIEKLNVRPVYMLHDVIPITHPEYCRAGEEERHGERVLTILDHGHGVIANSADTVEKLHHIAAAKNRAVPPATVALLGTRLLQQADLHAASPLQRPYFVMLGTIEGRKNHLLILNIWRDLVARLGDRAPMLVIIGKRGWESEQVVDLLERCPALENHVLELPHCPDAQVTSYFRHARALLFPSWAEGYGMPLIEALAVQLPVIASDLKVFHEIAGDIPEYFKPIDGIGWMSAIEAYIPQDSARRTAQLCRMRDFKPPSWDDHFAIVDRWLSTLAP